MVPKGLDLLNPPTLALWHHRAPVSAPHRFAHGMCIYAVPHVRNEAGCVLNLATRVLHHWKGGAPRLHISMVAAPFVEDVHLCTRTYADTQAHAELHAECKALPYTPVLGT